MNTRTLPGKRLTALALFQLGAAERAVDTEDVAIRVAQLAPGRFRWKRYPEQIDLDAVRLSLKHLKEEDPPFATGGIRNGWMLTPAGADWCKSQVSVDLSTTTVVSDGAAMRDAWRGEAYRKFHEGERATITVYDLRALLRIDEYTSPRRRKERIQAATNAAAGDPDLSRLLAYLKTTFPGEWT